MIEPILLYKLNGFSAEFAYSLALVAYAAADINLVRTVRTLNQH